MPEDNQSRVKQLPIWSGPVEPVPLSGGLSNISFTVVDKSDKYVVRLGADIPPHHVFRDKEIAASRAAEELGISPPLVHAEPGIMVFKFIDGHTYTETDVRTNIGRIVPLIRRIHTDMPAVIRGAPAFFWVFHVIRDYAHTLRDTGSSRTGDLDTFLTWARTFEAAQMPIHPVFGHHDLLPANFIDDGARIWLIDWEYAGFGSPLFDLANIASNAGFERADELSLLAAYFGAEPDRDRLRAFDAMKCASLLREAMWSMVSEQVLSVPGVDFVAYAEENLDRFDQAQAAFKAEHGQS